MRAGLEPAGPVARWRGTPRCYLLCVASSSQSPASLAPGDVTGPSTDSAYHAEPTRRRVVCLEASDRVLPFACESLVSQQRTNARSPSSPTRIGTRRITGATGGKLGSCSVPTRAALHVRVVWPKHSSMDCRECQARQNHPLRCIRCPGAVTGGCQRKAKAAVVGKPSPPATNRVDPLRGWCVCKTHGTRPVRQSPFLPRRRASFAGCRPRPSIRAIKAASE